MNAEVAGDAERSLYSDSAFSAGSALKRRMSYYGIDWLATICGLTGVYLIGSKNRYGFLVMKIASLSWMTVGFMIGSWALVIGSAIFFGLHLRGWLKWRRDERELGFLETQEISVAK